MKTRRCSPRKRSLREASTPSKAVGCTDSKIATDSTTTQNRSTKRVSITPNVIPTKKHQRSKDSQIQQVPPYSDEYDCNDDDNDDEVEFLHTSFPVQSTEMPRKYGEENRSVPELPLHTNETDCSENVDANELKPILHTATLRETSNGVSTSPMTPLASPFPHKTSAYLQSLAEISHAVLWDARWRVGGSRQQRLFAWEQGDDMNALYKLSRRYIQLSQPLKHENQNMDAQASSSRDEEKETIENSTGDDNSEESRGSRIEDDPDDRCLETYSRLYFRKGPWFRLDNIYKSYYAPKTDALANTDISEPQTKKLTSPSKFFRRRNTTDHARSNGTHYPKPNSAGEDDYIDHHFLDLQMEAVERLLGDIERLFRMGLIRSFSNEEECGKTVGKRREKYDYVDASLLRQDEMRTILTKLGGGQKQKKRQACNPTKNAPTGSSMTTTVNLEHQQQPTENLIWKQMCQQQTIFNCFKNGRRSTVLPVIKHVHEILLKKWASTIIVKASKVEYIPSPILRSATKRVYNALLDLTSKAGSKSTIMCIRLREDPVRTLRRASRLYLCATSGPGDMRNNGTNAWRSLPGSHNKDLQKIQMRTNLVAPPGSSWNTITYPGKDWRLRVLSCHFIDAFKPMTVNDFGHDSTFVTSQVISKKGGVRNEVEIQKSKDKKAFPPNNHDDIQVFSSVESFHQWEMGVDLRENCDFLLELNDLILYNERRQAREKKASGEESDVDDEEVDDDDSSTNQSSSEDDDSSMAETIVDFLDLLTITGRAKIIRGLLTLKKDDGKSTIAKIEQDVSTLLGIPLGDRPLSALLVSTATGKGNESSRLKNECERILGVIGILLIHILESRNGSIHQTEAACMVKRPWLRHMYWEGCTSYILWDIIPILERRGYYEFAISALEVLLFGKRLPRTSGKITPNGFSCDPEKNRSDFLYSFQPLISRRARGKALDRLIIDYTHFVRKNERAIQLAEPENKQTPARSKKKKAPKTSAYKVANIMAESFLSTSVASGQISFSSIRTLARRLKRPLSRTLEGLKSYEASELGHRFSNGGDEEQDLTKYNDWTPVTDTAIANAMSNDRDSMGGRCSFVGFEQDDHAVRMGSLNVEELAKEYYHQGRLPVGQDETTPKGGWIGYHDEGGKIRILFRILSSAVLGMDWDADANPNLSASETSTIHLTPYQGAPFDLHVGAEHVGASDIGCRGIYERRKSSIVNFLGELSNLDGEDLSDFVYDCISKRVQYTNALNRLDPTLERDIQQVRTLSMLAVGFGGKMLAAIFRCLFFDYRHYSGGLPDLLMVRALYVSPAGCESATSNQPAVEALVDLGEWVGEDFSSEHQEAIRAKQISRIFMDTDSDFLGCSKVGDSGGRATNRFQRGGRSHTNTAATEGFSTKDGKSRTPYTMPEKLMLSHDSRQIRVECMFVEVKSQNDRLDARQEDWLNILDRHGNARVCKFGKPPKRKKSTRTTSTTSSS